MVDCYIHGSRHFNKRDTARQWIISICTFFFWIKEWIPWTRNCCLSGIELKCRKVTSNQTAGIPWMAEFILKFLHYHNTNISTVYSRWMTNSLAVSRGLSEKLALPSENSLRRIILLGVFLLLISPRFIWSLLKVNYIYIYTIM